MRFGNIFIFFLFLAALYGCQKDIDYDFDKAEPMLIVNSQMVAGEQTHAVYLSISKGQTIERINSGTIKCTVNDGAPIEAVPDTEDNDQNFIRNEGLDWFEHYNPGQMRMKRFVFSADLKAGDKITLECTANGEYKASAEVTVPKAPAFRTVDTSTVYDNSEVYQENSYKIRLRGQDIPGEKSFFRLTTNYRRTDILKGMIDENGEKKDTVIVSSNLGLYIYKGSDPILIDGAPSEDFDVNGAAENYFNAFSDNLFRDGTFDLSYEIRQWAIINLPEYEHDWETAESTVEVYPTIWGISEVEYDFLKALSMYYYIDEDFTFSGPISFPDNVDGGIGIVAALNPSRDTITFRRSFGSSTNF